MSTLWRLIRGLILIILLLSCLVVGIWLMWIALVDVFHGKSILVPDYKGVALSNALEQKPAGLEFKVVEQKESRLAPAGVIIDQKPVAGSVVKRGRDIQLTLSLGASKSPMVRVIGLDLRRAGLELRRAGFRVGRLSYLPGPLKNEGKVLAQEPLEGSLAGRETRVSLLIGSQVDKVRRVPNFRGLSLQQATDLSVRENWELAEVEEKWDSQKPEGVVLNQEPVPGLEWIFVQKSDKMSKIRLVVNRKQQISGELSGISSWQRVEIKMPPGLSPRELRVEQVDGDGVHEIYRKTHLPEAIVMLDVQSRKNGVLNLYIENLFYRRLKLDEEI